MVRRRREATVAPGTDVLRASASANHKPQTMLTAWCWPVADRQERISADDPLLPVAKLGSGRSRFLCWTSVRAVELGRVRRGVGPAGERQCRRKVQTRGSPRALTLIVAPGAKASWARCVTPRNT